MTVKDRSARGVRPEPHADLDCARRAGSQVPRRQRERIPPYRLVDFLSVDFNDLKWIDMDVERMLENVFVDEGPLGGLSDFALDRRHHRIELLAVDEELNGLRHRVVANHPVSFSE